MEREERRRKQGREHIARSTINWYLTCLHNSYFCFMNTICNKNLPQKKGKKAERKGGGGMEGGSFVCNSPWNPKLALVSIAAAGINYNGMVQ